MYRHLDACIHQRWRIPIAGMLYMLFKLDKWGSLAYADRHKTIYAISYRIHLAVHTYVYAHKHLDVTYRLFYKIYKHSFTTFMFLPSKVALLNRQNKHLEEIKELFSHKTFFSF